MHSQYIPTGPIIDWPFKTLIEAWEAYRFVTKGYRLAGLPTYEDISCEVERRLEIYPCDLVFEIQDVIMPNCNCVRQVLTSGKIVIQHQITCSERAPEPILDRWPQECHLCHVIMEDPEDRTQFHGLGNCVSVCDSCHGSGQQTAEQTQAAAEMVQAVEVAKKNAKLAALLFACKKLCVHCKSGCSITWSNGQPLHANIPDQVGAYLCSASEIHIAMAEFSHDNIQID